MAFIFTADPKHQDWRIRQGIKAAHHRLQRDPLEEFRRAERHAYRWPGCVRLQRRPKVVSWDAIDEGAGCIERVF